MDNHFKRLIVILFLLSFPSYALASNHLYEYDNNSRLISVKSPGAEKIDYSYDVVGNRLSLNSAGMNYAAPVITDAGTYSLNNTQLNLHVGLLPLALGDLIYEFAVGTSVNGSDILPWAPSVVQSDGNLQLTGLNLPWGHTYFVSVRVRNYARELFTPTGSTDGITVLNPEDDSDNDGASNLQELSSGTNPFNSDSDNDKIPDGWEIQNQLNPLSDDALSDKDDDGFSNLREFVSQSNPSDYNDLPNCISDYDQDGDVDGYDLSMLIEELGRSDCTTEDPCACDKYLDGSVNEIEFLFFREDFGRDECQ